MSAACAQHGLLPAIQAPSVSGVACLPSRTEAAVFSKTFSAIAPDSNLWFSIEPDLIVELRSARANR